MNEKTYKLAGCTQFKAIMMVEKQTLFQSLFLILSNWKNWMKIIIKFSKKP